MGISDDRRSGSGGPDAPGTLPTPLEIRSELDRHVLGQEDAKAALSLAAYTHYFGLAADQERKEPIFGKQHVLLVGPTGSGKSYLVRRLAQILDVPVALCSATSLVEAGYVGEQCDSLLRTLLAAADGDVKRAERGIVFVDEFDKVRRVRGSGSRDVSGEGVQNALLTYLDGIQVNVGMRGDTHLLDTSGILFLCAGAFVDLAEHVAAEKHSSSIGFGAEDSATAVLQLSDTKPLVDFGLIPEILGRFGTIQVLAPLACEDLQKILTQVEDSVLRRKIKLLEAHGAKLRFTDSALRAVAERAHGLGTGARSLDRVMNDLLNPVLHRFFETEGNVREIVVGKPTVDTGAAARFILGPAESKHDDSIRDRAFLNEPAQQLGTMRSPGRTGAFTDTRGWPRQRMTRLLRRIKHEHLEWQSASHPAQGWWSRFEKEHGRDLRIVVRTAEELRNRCASIQQFFDACHRSHTENIQANLHFLDYERLKAAEDQKKRERKQAERKDRPESLFESSEPPADTGELPFEDSDFGPDDEPPSEPPFNPDDVPF